MYTEYLIEAWLGMIKIFVLPAMPVFVSWQLFVRFIMASKPPEHRSDYDD